MHSARVEKRSRPRLLMQFPVIISGSTTPNARGITRDVSQTGVFFYTESPMTLGQVVDFKMLLPLATHVNTRAACKGTVVRVESGNPAAPQRCGVAVQITSIELG